MLAKKRKTIGVLINRTGFFFENTVYREVQRMGKKYDFNVLVFATLGHRNSANYYDELERAMFAFAPLEKLDGLIITPDTYQMEGFLDMLYDALRTRVTCPIVSIRDHRSPYDQVFTDEDKAIRPLLKHLMEDHGYKRIHFLAGFAGHPDSEARLRCYYDEMAKHGLPLPQNAVHYGTMWRSGGDVACDYFFQEGLPKPEAIVCANDYMAQAVSEELADRGLRIPEDICVTGFDNVEDQNAFSVPVTTVEQDYPGIIEQAFALLSQRMDEYANGHIDPTRRTVGLASKLILRRSCGCPYDDDVRSAQERILLDSQQMQKIRLRETSQMYFSIDMNAAITMKEMHDTIMRKREDVPEMRDFYLCCFEKQPGTGERDGYAEELTDHVALVSCIKDHQDMGMPMECFSRDQLLPDWVWDSDEQQSFFVRLLHQRDSFFGYCMIRYEEGHIPSLFFHQWNVTIANALRHLFNQQKLQRLYEERRLSSITDPLTSTHNRRGLEENIMPTWEQRCQQHEPVAVMTFDMDNLKPINDTYGHGAGDKALQTVAMVLRRLEWEGAVSARIGGDEFFLFLPKCSEAEAQNVLATIMEDLALQNKKNGTPYEAAMSAGVFATVLDTDTTLDNCIRESDKRMYANKRLRKLQG